MKREVNEKFLRDNGFYEYDPTFMDCAAKCFEKKYENEYGTYYLVIKKYAEVYRNDRLMFSERYEAFARLYKYGTHQPIEITFSFTDIDEINNFILQMFKNKMIESCTKTSSKN